MHDNNAKDGLQEELLRMKIQFAQNAPEAPGWFKASFTEPRPQAVDHLDWDKELGDRYYHYADELLKNHLMAPGKFIYNYVDPGDRTPLMLRAIDQEIALQNWRNRKEVALLVQWAWFWAEEMVKAYCKDNGIEYRKHKPIN